MGHYDIQQVCLNGHQVTANYSSSPEFRRDFCATCGEKRLRDALHVITIFLVSIRLVALYVGTTDTPEYCEHCGAAFPWTEKKSKLISSSLKASSVSNDYFGLVKKICSRFHLVANQLKTRHSNRESLVISDEYDVQDLLHALLHIYFDDIRPEEWTPNYAGGSSRVDFY